jgi:multicomponent Na+:H+ antiporter subunit C
MPPYLCYALAGAGIFCIGVAGVLLSSHLLRKIMALNLSASGVFLLLISIAQRNARAEPDPVPHAMVLTGLVVALAATAFAITLVRRIHAHTGATSLAGFSGREEEDL